MAKRLTKKQQAERNLKLVKERELQSGNKPKFIKPGTNGESLGGEKRWG